MTPIQASIYEGRSISALRHDMTDADRRWLAREVKAGRVYRRKGAVFRNCTYWISANRAADLDAEEDAALARILLAGMIDDFNRRSRA